ncbi:MAG: imidazolonepropionase [Bacteroidetes bacterium]|nr:imidazolonepropionase [Bacteroidota bacterium]
MGSVLIKNIKALYGIDESGAKIKAGSAMATLNALENAWLWIEDGLIADYGSMKDFDLFEERFMRVPGIDIKDASGRFVLPSYVDSHTHLVFSHSREEEFVMRIQGKTYEEIAAAGGGILNSAAKLRQMSENELLEGAYARLQEVMKYGTGAIEIKSGYGLTVEDELKILRVIKRLKLISPIEIKATFLGAHAIPTEFKSNRKAYIDLVVNEMLPKVAEEQLADYVDVFCDQGFFTVEETDLILKEAAKYGLRGKIHGNELGITGGVQVAVANNALSVDHLEHMGQEEIDCLKASNTMPVALPNCSFFLGLPYAPVRKLIDHGLPVCLATDYNPGSSPNGRMGFVISLACIQMKLTPEEAINAATINGAYALDLSDTHGSITRGKRGNVFITKEVPSLAYMPYSFGVPNVETAIIGGRTIAVNY